ncbi:MAG: roadblock/LC7 domain-containing protein [bacterium]|jgi:predicted regulator of Ras-like GTPase activity (Roadblock/LC7/MglB family)
MAGNVKDLMRSLVGGIEGVVGAAVVGMDGAMIEALKVDQGFPLEEMSGDGAMASKVLDYLCQKVDGGPIDHIMLVAERYIILLAMAGQDYYVGIVINPRGNVGKARLQLRRYMPEIASVLNAGVI